MIEAQGAFEVFARKIHQAVVCPLNSHSVGKMRLLACGFFPPPLQLLILEYDFFFFFSFWYNPLSGYDGDDYLASHVSESCSVPDDDSNVPSGEVDNLLTLMYIRPFDGLLI